MHMYYYSPLFLLSMVKTVIYRRSSWYALGKGLDLALDANHQLAEVLQGRLQAADPVNHLLAVHASQDCVHLQSVPELQNIIRYIITGGAPKPSHTEG